MQLVSLLGLVVLLAVAWAMSTARREVRLRTGAWGLGLQFLLAVAVFHETFTLSHLATFALIWSALAVFSWESVRRYRQSLAVGPDI